MSVVGGYDEFTVPVAQFDAYPRVVQSPVGAAVRSFPVVRTCVWVGVAVLVLLSALFYFYKTHAPAYLRSAGAGVMADPYFTSWDALSRKTSGA